jgi:hypothetical protein
MRVKHNIIFPAQRQLVEHLPSVASGGGSSRRLNPQRLAQPVANHPEEPRTAAGASRRGRPEREKAGT